MAGRGGDVALLLLLSWWIASTIAEDFLAGSRWLLLDGLMLVVWVYAAGWVLRPRPYREADR